MAEIGKLDVTPDIPNPSAEDIEKFFAALKQSVLDALARGEHVYVSTEPAWNEIEPQFFGGQWFPGDATYAGRTVSISVGLPAQQAKGRELARQWMENHQ